MSKVNRVYTNEDIDELKRSKGTLTVGELKRIIEDNDIPDDAIIMTERIEDVYYEKYKWGVYLHEGYMHWESKKHNADIHSGKYLDKEKYPDITEDDLKIIPDEILEEYKDQYSPASSCFVEDIDNTILFIRLHI